MDEIHSRGVRDFLQIETVARQCGLKIKLCFRAIAVRGNASRNERRKYQTRENQCQNNSCREPSFHLGGELLREF